MSFKVQCNKCFKIFTQEVSNSFICVAPDRIIEALSDEKKMECPECKSKDGFKPVSN